MSGKYDFNKVRKELNKYIPKGIYNPFSMHSIGDCAWTIDLSERSTGKTTSWLLMGLCMKKYYPSFSMVYVRETTDMIMPKHSSEIFNVIIENDYIKKIFKEWDTVVYKSRKWFLKNTETGDIDDKPFMYSVSVNENALNKSSLNIPNGDLIIFDEFISRYNYSNEMVDFCDTLSTIIRERFSPLIVLLGNTIDRQSFWFKELCIYRDVLNLAYGRNKVIETPFGTVVDVAIIGTVEKKKKAVRQEHNRRYFGFENPKLNSIRGGEWAIANYPHTLHTESSRKILNNIYICHNQQYLHLELWKNNENGYYINVHSASTIYVDSIVYTTDTQYERRYKYGYGDDNLDRFIWRLWKINHFYFATNLDGNLFESYLKSIEKRFF